MQQRRGRKISRGRGGAASAGQRGPGAAYADLARKARTLSVDVAALWEK